MRKEEIHWADWHRILFGTAPEMFLVEVLFRTIIIYFMLLFILRLMGKRMGGQLTISELAVMLTLGAIISIPMQVPDKGLLQGLLVLVCALIFQRGITFFAIKSRKVEHFTQGTESVLIVDGVLVAAQLKKMNISRQQMLAVLRNQKIYNLGEVRRAYLEACGLFSIFKYKEAKPGLPLLPKNDGAAAKDFIISDKLMVCEQCGNPAQQHSDAKCNNCGSDCWTPAAFPTQKL